MYENMTTVELQNQINQCETKCTEYTEARSNAEKEARKLRKQIGEMQTVLLKKLTAAAPSKK